jgi:hypothetical protein
MVVYTFYRNVQTRGCVRDSCVNINPSGCNPRKVAVIKP